jgi:predicted alpha/beta hydrolase
VQRVADAAPTEPRAPVERERFALRSGDGVELAAARYAARPERAPAVVVTPATGVPQGFYRAFAQWLAERGSTVYTLDYRGIGASRPARLRGFHADFASWTADIDALLAHALSRHAQVSLLGHSSGGFLAPIAPSAVRLHRLVLVGAQTAYWRDWAWPQRWPMALLWHGLMPLVTGVVGYFPARALRLGEDLPRGAALDWALRPWRDPFERAEPAAGYARALPPLHLVAAADDLFATPAALERMRARLVHTALEQHIVAPAEAGLRRLGHFAILRPEGAAVWPQLRGWLVGAPAGDDPLPPRSTNGDAP